MPDGVWSWVLRAGLRRRSASSVWTAEVCTFSPDERLWIDVHSSLATDRAMSVLEDASHDDILKVEPLSGGQRRSSLWSMQAYEVINDLLRAA